MRAIVVGATGATGKELVRQLLADREFTFVEVFVRRDMDIQHPKLLCHVIDFDDVDKWKHLINGDVAFCCLGSTLKDAGSKEEMTKIDYCYPMQFAQNCKSNGVKSFVLLSSIGANSRSKVFYPKLKGNLENVVLNLHFDKTTLVRPSVLIRPNTDRLGEKLGIRLLHFFNKFNCLMKYKPVSVATVAHNMIKAGTLGEYGINIIENKEM